MPFMRNLISDSSSCIKFNILLNQNHTCKQQTNSHLRIACIILINPVCPLLSFAFTTNSVKCAMSPALYSLWSAFVIGVRPLFLLSTNVIDLCLRLELFFKYSLVSFSVTPFK